MLARLARALPGEGYHYEPKWDGFRALVFRDGDAVDIRSRNDRKLARYFPEVVEAVRALPATRVVLDGEIVVVGRAGLDFAALMSRLHPAATRVAQLREETPAALVAFDLLAEGDEDLRSAPFLKRRARLEALLANASSRIVATPATTELSRAEEWLARFGGSGIDGVVAKHPQLAYLPNQRAMIKVKRERTADCVVAGFRLHGGQPKVGSLLLGMYQGDALVHFGVVSQLTDAMRKSLLRELGPEVTKLEGHPWEQGFGLERSPLGRLKGAAGRWSPEMERDWFPLPPTRVCEIAYDVVDDRRLRYPARFVRFRPDRDARSCHFDQLEEAPPDVRALVWP